MDTDPSLLLLPAPLRRVPDMLGCLESPKRERRRERKRRMTINRLSHHLRGDTLANSWMDGRMERENDKDRQTEREKECVRERAGVLYAHYAQVFRVHPGTYSSQSLQ